MFKMTRFTCSNRDLTPHSCKMTLYSSSRVWVKIKQRSLAQEILNWWEHLFESRSRLYAKWRRRLNLSTKHSFDQEPILCKTKTRNKANHEAKAPRSQDHPKWRRELKLSIKHKHHEANLMQKWRQGLKPSKKHKHQQAKFMQTKTKIEVIRES